MKRLSITLYNFTPFSVASSRAVSNIQESLDFISGTLIRGAIAKKWLEEGKPDNDFKEIFTTDKVSFGNLYIEDSKPIPLSAFTCKYYSGFRWDNDNHGVMDKLLSLTRLENRIKIPDEIFHCHHIENEEKCCAPMKKFNGYFLNDSFDDPLKHVKVKKRLINHTGISHISETALENALFSQEVVESGQTFKGEIRIYDDKYLEKLTDLINNSDIVYLGSDKSTGFGKFSISYSEIDDEPDTKNKMKNRISKFNDKLGINNVKIYFSATLQSDMIITDKYMRYKTLIQEDDLVGIPELEFIYGIAESRLIQGWNAMAKLPKEDVTAIEKGSVFIFSVKTLNDDTLNKVYDFETKGIGKRTGEGFGRLSICDPFHIDEGLK